MQEALLKGRMYTTEEAGAYGILNGDDIYSDWESTLAAARWVFEGCFNAI